MSNYRRQKPNFFIFFVEPIDSVPNKIFEATAREEVQKGIKSLLTLVGSEGARQVLRVISSPLNYGGTNGVEDFIPFDWFHALYKGTDQCGIKEPINVAAKEDSLMLHVFTTPNF